MGRKGFNLQDVKNYFEEIGFTLLSNEYINSRTKLFIKCPNNHTYHTTLSNFKQCGEKCIFCEKEKDKRRMYEKIKTFIEKEGYELLSDKYINAQEYLELICPLGHTFKMSWNNFQSEHRCPYCVRKQLGEKLRLDEEFIKRYVTSQGYTLISIFRKNEKLRIEVICPKGHRYSTDFNNFKHGNRCRKCAGSQRFTYEEVKEIIEKEGYELLSTEYKNAYSTLELRCPEGHIYTTKFHNFKYGNVRCHYCHKASKGERRIMDWLDKNNINYIYDEAYFEDLMGDFNLLRPDFIIEDRKIWIEFDGEFHFKDFYKDGTYEKMISYDKFKDEYAKKNGWELIRIPYWEFDNIEEILDKYLK